MFTHNWTNGAAAFTNTPPQPLPLQAVAKDPPLRQLAHDAFRSFVRSYATHPGELFGNPEAGCCQRP